MRPTGRGASIAKRARVVERNPALQGVHWYHLCTTVLFDIVKDVSRVAERSRCTPEAYAAPRGARAVGWVDGCGLVGGVRLSRLLRNR